MSKFSTTTKALQRISDMFGEPVIPLCTPSKNGGCQVIGAGHGPSCPHPGKRPLVKGWQSPDWKLTPDALERYVRMGANWGVRLGNGLVELDFDDPASYQEFIASHALPGDTPVMLTGRKGGGYKLILRATKPPPKNFIHNGFEVRSKGLLVIPDSLHQSGNRYRWLRLNGCIPKVDLEALLGVTFSTIQGPKQSAGERPPLTTEQQKAAEGALFEYLPGARYINDEICGYLDINSQSKAHIKANIEKGVYMDWRKGEGGTIRELLHRIGAPLPPELGAMGKEGIPEYFPIWAINRYWKDDWQCGQLVVVARSDGAPIWSGKAFCLQWQCPECSIRLKNILKARLKTLPALQVWEAPPGTQAKLARLKRASKSFHYARAKNREAEYVLVREEDQMDTDLLAASFKRSELKPEDVVDGLPYAVMKKRREKRFIPSRNFWAVGVNNNTLPAESNNINSDNREKQGETEAEKEKKQMAKLDKKVEKLLNRGRTPSQIAEKLGVEVAEVKASIHRIEERGDKMDKKPFDIVVLDDNYEDVLERLEARGFQLWDTGEGESHRIRYPGVKAPQVDPEELGEVVEVISY